jgi:hypothetical protein
MDLQKELDALRGQALSDPEREAYFAMKKKAAECDTLRECYLAAGTEFSRLLAERDTLRVDVEALHRVIDTYRNKSVRLEAEGNRVLNKMIAYRSDCETLRELVREALSARIMLSGKWVERAEKALNADLPG